MFYLLMQWPSKHAGLESGVLVMASYDLGGLCACNQNRAGSYEVDPTSGIRFGATLRRRPRSLVCKTSPDSIFMMWLGFGQTYLVRKQAGVQESLVLVLAECNWYHYQFPTFRLSENADHIVQNQPVSQLVLADRQVLAEWIWAGSKLVCKNHWACFWPKLLR